jgi:hypothetical protein
MEGEIDNVPKEGELPEREGGIVIASLKILSYNFFMRWPLIKTNKSDHKVNQRKKKKKRIQTTKKPNTLLFVNSLKLSFLL